MNRERRPSERSELAYEAERAARRERERARAEEEARAAVARANQAAVKNEEIKPNKNLTVSMYLNDDGYSDIASVRILVSTYLLSCVVVIQLTLP